MGLGRSKHVEVPDIETLLDKKIDERRDLAAATAVAADWLAGLNERTLLEVLQDTRPLHRALYGQIAPEHAGIWRSTPGTALEKMSRCVYVSRRLPGLRRADPCAPPAVVAARMADHSARIAALHIATERPPDPMSTLATVTAQFFQTHPYADGNGHTLRLMLKVLAPHLGLTVHPTWTLHRRPYDATMSFCIQWFGAHPSLLSDHMRRWFSPR